MNPPEHIIQFAVDASIKSPCRSKRGAAIFDGDNLVSVGCNDKPNGFVCNGSERCKETCAKEAVHAEQAALVNTRAFGCEMLHVKTVGGALVPSGGPSCLECSKLILAAGLNAMWLYHADGWCRYTAHEFHRLTLESKSLMKSLSPIPVCDGAYVPNGTGSNA